jgi:hypothetical protein
MRRAGAKEGHSKLGKAVQGAATSPHHAKAERLDQLSRKVCELAEHVGVHRAFSCAPSGRTAAPSTCRAALYTFPKAHQTSHVANVVTCAHSNEQSDTDAPQHHLAISVHVPINVSIGNTLER